MDRSRIRKEIDIAFLETDGVPVEWRTERSVGPRLLTIKPSHSLIAIVDVEGMMMA